jgi:hypothetical protein
LANGSSLVAPGLGELSSNVSAVAGIACTLGTALETRVSELCRQRSMSLAFALDAVGNELLMYTARCATLAIRREARLLGLSAGDALTPGGSGFSLGQQLAVLDLAEGVQLGIRLRGQGMLYPVKTRTLVVGVGVGLTAKPLCRRCEGCESREACRYRKR